jgi:mono/diheme cytochrome c family protein
MVRSRHPWGAMLAVLLLTVAGGSAAAGELMRSGEEQFQVSCAACHPRGDNVLEPEHPIKRSIKLKNFSTFLGWIRKPVLPMPEFPPSALSDAQAKELYAYILRQEGTGWK